MLGLACKPPGPGRWLRTTGSPPTTASQVENCWIRGNIGQDGVLGLVLYMKLWTPFWQTVSNSMLVNG